MIYKIARRFQEEILDFVHYLSPTAEEHRIRQYIVNRIQNVVSGIWPDATVNVFGSFNTQLYLPSSDIDLVVLTPSCKDLSSRSVLQTLAKKLRKSGLVYGKTLDIIPARVPIVKFTDCIGQYSIDISHGIENGIAAANRMTELIKEYPAIRFVVFV
jgi:non-canonical poly(A) RNA polymerase PAPD5/7